MSDQNLVHSGEPITVFPALALIRFELEHASIGQNDNRGPVVAPASKASIDAMEKVEVTSEAGPSECSICLEGLKVGCEAKEMPNCKHRFHPACIATWLLRHASCPLCRSTMPIQEEDQANGWNSYYQADDRNSMRFVFNIDEVQPVEWGFRL